MADDRNWSDCGELPKEDGPAPSEQGAEPKEGKPKKAPKLLFAVISFAGIGMTMTPLVKYVPQSMVLATLFLAIGSAIIVAVGILQDVFAARHYFGFDNAKYIAGLLIPLVAYCARKLALDDVNAIFHIDPGPLPMTLSAAMVVNLMVPLLYIFTFASGPAIWFLFKSPSVSEAAERARRAAAEPAPKWWHLRRSVAEPQFIAFAILFASMIGGICAYYQLNEDGRRRLIYMVALSTDFNSKFTCDGLKPAKRMGALFIGPDQGKALLAAEFDDSPNPQGPMIPGGELPTKFPIVDCVAPKTDVVAWMAENHLVAIVESGVSAEPSKAKALAQPKIDEAPKPAIGDGESKGELVRKSKAASEQASKP